ARELRKAVESAQPLEWGGGMQGSIGQRLLPGVAGFLVFTMSAWPYPAAAQTAPPTPSPPEAAPTLDEVQVTGSRIITNGTQSPTPLTAANGTVDVNTLPQMLVERVDVVTGGASAVYGSDAVAGVVNFVLNKHF